MCRLTAVKLHRPPRPSRPRAPGPRQTAGGGQPPRPLKHRPQHRLRQPPRRRILLARVVRRNQPRQPRPQLMHPPMLKRQLARLHLHSLPPQCPQIVVKRNPPQRHHHPHIPQQPQLPHQKPPARLDLLRRRFVVRRRAPRRRRDPRIAQLQPILPPVAHRLRRKPRLMQHAIQEIARLVAREHPPRPVRSMRPRRQPHNQHPRPRIPKRRHRLPPILLMPVRPPLHPRHLLAMRPQPRTSRALHNIGFQ